MNEFVSWFEMAEGEFLLIWSVFGLTLIIAIGLRSLLRTPHKWETGSLLDSLDPYLIAYLSGNAEAATNAAIASLVLKNALKLDTVRVVFLRAGSLPAGAHPVEAVVFGLVTPELGSRLNEVRAGAKQLISTELHKRLVELGLIVAPFEKIPIIILPMLIGLIAPGIAFLTAASSQPLPEETLVNVLMFAVVIAACVLILFARPPFRSRYGDDVLNQLRIKHAKLRMHPSSESGLADSNSVAIAVGLFGVVVLRHIIPLAHLQNLLDPPEV